MKLDGLFQDLKRLLDTAEPAGLGPERRTGTLSTAEIDTELTGAFGQGAIAPAVKDLFRGAIYLWHDHLDEAHTIVQAIETPDGS